MKKNLVPLLGIAVVVAIAATGIFYGLFVGKLSGASATPEAKTRVVAARAVEKGMVITAADVRLEAGGAPAAGGFDRLDAVIGRKVSRPVKESEAVLAEALAPAAAPAGMLNVPKGMRAISLRLTDSAGLIPYLRAGNRVDVQAIDTRHGDPRVETVLRNVEVLGVHQDTSAPVGTAVVNLLVEAPQVERVALADSTGKVRIVLRNTEDESAAPVRAPAVAPSSGGASRAVAAVGPEVRFSVRMAVVAAETARAMLDRATPAGGSGGAVRIGLLPQNWRADTATAELEKTKALRWISDETVGAAPWHEVTLQAGAEGNPYDFRLRLTPRGGTAGQLRLRVKPELTLPQRGGVSSRRFLADLEVANGQSVLVGGFERDTAVPALAAKLFQQDAASVPGELLVFVTPSLPGAAAR